MSVTLCLGCSHAPHKPLTCPVIPAFQRRGDLTPCRCTFGLAQTYIKRTSDDTILGYAMDPRD